MSLKLLWVRANNVKTGPIPAAYVGSTPEEAWESCEGCSLRDSRRCYAWAGFNRVIFTSQHAPKFADKPHHFTIEAVLKRVDRKIVRAARVGVLGDPSRADRIELAASITVLRREGLSILGYTHFWREASSAWLREELMASCDTLEEADEAHALGWRPATILPWDHQEKRFATPGGLRGVVCPAQTKDKVTCNSCRMCDPQHPVWSSGKVDAIGFIDHSRKARTMHEREAANQMPLFAPEARMKKLDEAETNALKTHPEIAARALEFHYAAQVFAAAGELTEPEIEAARLDMNKKARELEYACGTLVGEYSGHLSRVLRAVDPAVIAPFLPKPPVEEEAMSKKTPPKVAEENSRRIKKNCESCGKEFTWAPAFASHEKWCKAQKTEQKTVEKKHVEKPKKIVAPVEPQTALAPVQTVAPLKVERVADESDLRESAFGMSVGHDASCEPCRHAVLLEDRCAIGQAYLRRWVRLETSL